MKPTLKIGFVQQACGSPDPRINLDASIRGAREAAARGAELILLPELHLGPYFCQTEDTARFDLAEPIPGPTTKTLGALAGELGAVIVASLFEKRAPGLYHNTAAVLEKDGSLAGHSGHHQSLNVGDRQVRNVDGCLRFLLRRS